MLMTMLTQWVKRTNMMRLNPENRALEQTLAVGDRAPTGPQNDNKPRPHGKNTTTKTLQTAMVGCHGTAQLWL
jgi:hypothetical protein